MRKHRLLRGRMVAYDVDAKYMSDKIGIGKSTYDHSMAGYRAWTLDEVYAIMDALNVPYDQMHLFFPKDGVGKPPERIAL